MSNNTMGILIGGLLPAIFYGLFPVFMKLANERNLSPGALLVCVGISSALVGLIYMFFTSQNSSISVFSGSQYGLLAGLFWSLGALGVTLAINYFNAPIAVITPLFNTNTLVAVLLGLIIFSEGQNLNIRTLIIGMILIITGGIVISRA